MKIPNIPPLGLALLAKFLLLTPLCAQAGPDPGDTDADGLADAWEITYFGNITDHTGISDPDRDRYTNEAEESAGSNPNDGISTPQDIEGDGLPDSWEIYSFGNTTSQTGTGDPDNDGYNNKAEYIASSNPNNPASIPGDADGDGFFYAGAFDGIGLVDATGGDTMIVNSSGTPLATGIATGGYFTLSEAEVAAAASTADYARLLASFVPLASDDFVAGLNGYFGETIPGFHYFHADLGTQPSSLLARKFYSFFGNGSSLGTSSEWALVRHTTSLAANVSPHSLLFNPYDDHTVVLGTSGSSTYSSALTGPNVPVSTIGLQVITVFRHVTIVAPVHGSVSGNTGNYADGTTATLLATPTPGYVFQEWTGDASGTTNPLELVMNSDKTLSATFAPDTSDNDGDGFSNYDEVVTYSTDPNNAASVPGDGDGDGLADPWEVANFGSMTAQTGTGDADGDGHTNEAEETAGSNPTFMASTPLDVEGDGLADAWEITHFTNTTAQSGTGDPDTDTYPNEAEETAGSDPNLAASTPLDIDGDGLADAWEVAYFGSTSTHNGEDDPDGDGTSNETEETAGSAPNNALSVPSDLDADGLQDVWEVSYFGDITTQTATGDPDADNLSNLQEQSQGTNPANKDTDGDGLSDSQEISLTQTNPALIDTDGDGISDANEDSDADGLGNLAEVATHGTNPSLTDSDNDGLTDGYELGLGRFSVVSGSNNWSAAKADAEAKGGTLATFTTEAEWNLALQSIGQDALWDVNGLWIGATDSVLEGTWAWVTDGPVSFSNWATGEPNNLNDSDYAAVAGDLGGDLGKWYDFRATTTRDGYILESGFATNPADLDSDDDGLSDGQEQTIGSNPLLTDTDTDGLTDEEEVKLTLTNPSKTDSNENGVSDAEDDQDNDGLTNLAELRTHLTNPNAADSDGDNLSDREELQLTSTNPNLPDTDNDGTPDAQEDADNDGLTNLAELRTHLTNPAQADSDSDALSDREELEQTATDPNLPDSDDDGTPDAQEDADNDGLTNLAELRTHLTNPAQADSDSDALSDREELEQTATNPNLPDTDDDGTPDAQEDADNDGLTNLAELRTHLTNPAQADSDSDALSDREELEQTSTNPNLPDSDDDGTPDAQEDADNDGLTNLAELRTHLTNPAQADSDSDALSDREELEQTATNPNLPDTDGDGTPDAQEDADNDGLTNLAELRTHLTNPAQADSDGDLLSDREELEQTATDPNLPDSDDDGTPDAQEDADNDGLTNLAELRTHLTNPAQADSDSDALSDREELEQTATNPNLPDTDGDGTPDAQEDADKDGLTNLAELRTHLTNPAQADSDSDALSDREELEQTATNPNLPDSDDDGTPDAQEDADNDGLTNLAELRTHLTNPAQADSDSDGLSDREELEQTATNPNLPDTDNDGLNDGNEVNTYGSDPLNRDTDGDGLTDGDEVARGSNPKGTDTDGDGLSDREEVETHGTNPLVKDSDGDGFDDLFELNAGFNPTRADSTPDALTSIRTAVEFRFNSANGVSYRIEASTDLNTWETVETDIIGEGGVITRFYSIENQPKRYFRVRRN